MWFWRYTIFSSLNDDIRKNDCHPFYIFGKDITEGNIHFVIFWLTSCLNLNLIFVKAVFWLAFCLIFELSLENSFV